MRVVAADVREEALADVAAELRDSGVPHVATPVDVADASSVDRLRDVAVSRFGSVHVVHNNAGVALPPMPVWEVDPTLWSWILGVNLQGVINGIRSFVPLLVAQDQGHVVNTSSLAGLRTGPRLGAYTVTKQAVVALSEVLAADLARAGSNVGVSVVCPSAVPTNLTESSTVTWPAGAVRSAENQPRNDGSVPYTVVTADVVADRIHDAILANVLHVITHPETLALVSPRFARILDACRAVQGTGFVR